jgi:hypothetical protein
MSDDTKKQLQSSSGTLPIHCAGKWGRMSFAITSGDSFSTNSFSERMEQFANKALKHDKIKFTEIDVLISNRGYANECVAAILGTVTRRYVSYVGNPKLMNNVMSEISISVPSSIAEQTKIANFLSALDRKIETVIAQITHIQTFKKGLLQQMFV